MLRVWDQQLPVTLLADALTEGHPDTHVREACGLLASLLAGVSTVMLNINMLV